MQRDDIPFPWPDAGHFLDVAMGRLKGVPEGATGTSHEVRRGTPARDAQRACQDTFIEFWLRMGCDFVRFEREMGMITCHGGGLDINILTRAIPREVRREVGKLMEEAVTRRGLA